MIRPLAVAIMALTMALHPISSGAADALFEIPAIGVNAWERGDCMSSADYALLGSNGIRVFRTGFNQEEAGSLDDTVLRAAQGGVRILPILHTYVAPPTTEQQLTSFADFARDVARRYGPGGSFWFASGVPRTDIPYLPIRAWEVWNEPNLSSNWGGLPTSPAQYYALLARTRDAVRSADPGAVIVFAGLAFRGTDGNGNNAVTFLQQTLAINGATAKFEALGVHSYPPTPAELETHLTITRSTLDAAGSAAQIWLTEFGWPTGGTSSAHPAVSLTEQDTNLMQTLDRIETQRTALKLGPAFWFAYRDLTPGSTDPCQAGFSAGTWSNYLGLRTSQANGNTAKPAWLTFVTRCQSAQPLKLPLGITAADHSWLKQF